MKRGKDEKIMGPMFPRLHVNDTDKGGPRAPPRNKMALYEQLSIPSSRIPHPTATLVYPSSQGIANGRGMFPSYHMTTQPQSEKQYTQYPDLGTQLIQIEHRKESEYGEFSVPTFVPTQAHSPLHKCQKSEKNHRQPNLEKLMTDRINPLPPSATEKAKLLKKLIDSAGKMNANDSVESNPTLSDGNIMGLERRSDSTSVMDFLSGHKNILDDISNKMEFRERPYGSQPTTNLERVNSLSENSSICNLDIMPDDVVGIIGQKHFWKARREIVNQQRIFAVQVFELHRLMKVQRLIAASPHILFEDSAYFTTSSASVNNVPHPLSFSPQALGNQWLIPVMSPSEGLVYKPYLGPGFMGPAYGGCGPPWSSPLMTNFPNPPYVPPAPQFSSSSAVGPRGYFPQYGMPVMTGPVFSSSSSKQLSGPPFRDRNSALDLGGHQNQDGNLNASEDVEVQASIASSPVENSRETDSVRGSNVLPLFPTSPPTDGPKSGPRPPEADGLTRVIKVVPHNARSASESAARIFQAIQEGRKQSDLS